MEVTAPESRDLEDASAQRNIQSESNVDYLVSSEELATVDIELIDGNNSKCLVIDKAYICHINDQSIESDIVYWECKRRRHDKCPFKAATEMDDRGKLSLVYMYQLNTHTCDQDKALVDNQIFRNRVKERISTDQRAKYGKVFKFIF